MIPTPRIRRLGSIEYAAASRAMRRMCERADGASDEIWLLEHPPVLTLGVRADPRDIHAHATLPVVRSERGGRATCHAPGQLVAYLLLDLPRLGLGVRTLVARLEDALLGLCSEAGIEAHRRPGAPGVYCDRGKLASIGLRVRRGRASHGLALNVDPDLSLFRQAVLCGAESLRATSLRERGVSWSMSEARERLLRQLLSALYLPRARA